MGIILEVQNLYMPLGAIQSLDAITGERSLSGAKCLLCCEAEFKVMTWRLISSADSDCSEQFDLLFTSKDL